MEHICKEDKHCTCRIDGDEPNEDCFLHGGCPWPPRCTTCGKFLPWNVRQNEVNLTSKGEV